MANACLLTPVLTKSIEKKLYCRKLPVHLRLWDSKVPDVKYLGILR